MIKRLRFLSPSSLDQDQRNREIVLYVLLVGTFGLVLAGFILLTISFSLAQNKFVLTRLVIVGIILGVVSLLYLLRKRYYRLTSYGLIAIYFTLAMAIAYHWGFNTPTGILLFGIVIVLAGILLGARYSLYSLLIVAAGLLLFALAGLTGFLKPHLVLANEV